MKKSFKFELKIKGCSETFMEGLNPGVIASQVVTFDVDEKALKTPMFLSALLDAEDKFLKKHVEVVITKEL